MNMTTQHFEPVSAETAAELMAHMWEAAGMHAVPDCTTATAAKLLRAGGGFDVNRDLLERWAGNGTVPNVSKGSQGLQWSAINLFTAAGLANASRRWLLNSGHVSKMTAIEFEEGKARQRGETNFKDLDKTDFLDLIGCIQSSGTDSESRAMLCEALKTKIQRAGIE